MDLFYYKSDIGNFGDDLNYWLWPKLFGDFENYSKNTNFIGIGSILDERINSDKKSVIFGSGIRDVLSIPTIKDVDDIVFVRGPLSSRMLNNCQYITDAAYCLAILEKPVFVKKYEVSYIPYFRHYYNFNWKLFSKLSGINIIDPTSSLENIISEINSSKQILTSAMHGAILADIYRIPWQRVRLTRHGSESAFTSELKWRDWLLSMNIHEIEDLSLGFNLNSKASPIRELSKTLMLILRLKKNNLFYLSNEDIYNEKIELLKEKIEYIKEKYRLKCEY